jgi:hypothetical protein
LLFNNKKANAQHFVEKLVANRYQYLIETTPNFLTDKSYCDNALLPYTRAEIEVENEAAFAEAVTKQFNLFSQSSSVAR